MLLWLPLGATRQLQPCVMFNWLGSMPDTQDLLGLEGLHWHDYGKQARPGRKVGHATLAAASEIELQAACHALASQLGGLWPDLHQQLWN